MDRARYLELDDGELLRECRVDRFRASGPGGQKRNKTESAIRLHHDPTGLAAAASESRSQHENRARALRRLRERIALELREPVEDPDRWEPPPELAELVAAGRAGKKTRQSARYLGAAASLLDLFVAEGCSVAATARRLGLSTGALSRLLLADPRLAKKANELRSARGLRPLR